MDASNDLTPGRKPLNGDPHSAWRAVPLSRLRVGAIACACVAPPNTRLKLAAPVLNAPDVALNCGVVGFLIVMVSAWRRSLSAVR